MIGSKFILDILDLLLDGDDNGKAVRPQIDYLTELDYEYTGMGVFITFRSSEEILVHRVGSAQLVLDGVSIRSPELKIGASAIVFIKDGVVNLLEVWSYDGEYPGKELTSYTLKQEGSYGSGREIIHIG